MSIRSTPSSVLLLLTKLLWGRRTLLLLNVRDWVDTWDGAGTFNGRAASDRQCISENCVKGFPTTGISPLTTTGLVGCRAASMQVKALAPMKFCIPSTPHRSNRVCLDKVSLYWGCNIVPSCILLITAMASGIPSWSPSSCAILNFKDGGSGNRDPGSFVSDQPWG
jgi:hypothetical protein